MTFEDVKKRITVIEEKENRGGSKIFINIDYELDEEIERYKQEQPHDELVIINVVNPNRK